MPRLSGRPTQDWVSRKIAALRREGYPPMQAVAIAYSEARAAWSGRPLPAWLRGKSMKRKVKHHKRDADGKFVRRRKAKPKHHRKHKRGLTLRTIL